MKHTIIQPDVTSTLYKDLLTADIANHDYIMFSIAYLSQPAWVFLKQKGLMRLLNHNKSFGITSLCCFTPIDSLMDNSPNLKVFLNIIKKRPNEESLTLAHAKSIIFVKEPTIKNLGKVTIYQGSHNWTSAAIGLNGSLNSESSIRLEYELKSNFNKFCEENIEVSDLYNYLNRIYNLSCCLPVTNNYKDVFGTWKDTFCKKENIDNSFSQVLILNMVCSNPDYLKYIRKGNMYLCTKIQKEGNLIFEAVNKKVLIFIWKSESDVQNKVSPIIVTARISTAKRPGSNFSNEVIKGFKIWANGNEKKVIILDNIAIHTWILDYSNSEVGSKSITNDSIEMFEFQCELEQGLGFNPNETFGREESLFGKPFYEPQNISLTTKTPKKEKAKKVHISDNSLLEDITSNYLKEFRINPSNYLTNENLSPLYEATIVKDPINVFFKSPINENIIANDNLSFRNQVVFEEIKENIKTYIDRTFSYKLKADFELFNLK
jgi:hypothetical protein